MRARRTWMALAIVIAVAGTARAAAPVQGFLENRGQFDADVRFFGVSGDLTVRFEDHRVVLGATVFTGREDRATVEVEGAPGRDRERRGAVAARRERATVTFVGTRGIASVEGTQPLPGRYGFVLGRDAEQWKTDVPAWGRVVYRDVLPGVDVVFREVDGGLAYEIVSRARGGDGAVALSIEGTEAIIDDGGVLRIAAGTTVASPDRATDVIEADAEFGTDLRFSTFLGGLRDDAVYAVAVDSQNRPVVAGATRSAGFPTTAGALDTDYGGSFDAFVTKFDADGATVLWSTFLGGTGDDRAWALRLDGADRVVLAGVTASTDFPMAGTPYADALNGTTYDVFVAALEADGSALAWSTYYGGSATEWDVSGLALDATGRPVVSGSTQSGDLPLSIVTFDDDLGGTRDGFIARFAADGSALEFATYLGGSADDAVEDVAVDGTGAAIVVGRTYSADFPTTPGSFEPVRPGPTATEDGFVARLDLTTASLAFGTYLGAEGPDQAYAVALDGSGRPIVAGSTESAFFPVTPGSLRTEYAGLRDVFVAAVAADGSTLAWATYFGGGAGDRALDLALDRYARPLITGWTWSEDFPLVWNPYDTSFNGPCESFVARLHEDATYVEYSSFVGGWRDDTGYALALDDRERPVVGGEAFSSDFPSTPGAYDPTHNSPDDDYDGFLFALLPPTFCVETTGAGPAIAIAKATRGNGPAGGPIGGTVQVVEGALENLSPDDIGAVRALVCDMTTTVLDDDTVPPPGRGQFVLARFTPGGTYADGAGANLVGTRTPLAGDCP